MNRAEKTERLRTLAKSKKFCWSVEEDEFDFLRKNALKIIKRLGYYSIEDPIELHVDALGAVIAQYDRNSKPRIACASTSLTTTEQRYPQTQKAVECFYYYLLGRSFVIRTDSEAKEFIFSTNHCLGKRAVSRAESWALRLQPYDFIIRRVPRKKNVADTLSRLV